MANTIKKDTCKGRLGFEFETWVKQYKKAIKDNKFRFRKKLLKNNKRGIKPDFAFKDGRIEEVKLMIKDKYIKEYMLERYSGTGIKKVVVIYLFSTIPLKSSSKVTFVNAQSFLPKLLKLQRQDLVDKLESLKSRYLQKAEVAKKEKVIRLQNRKKKFIILSFEVTRSEKDMLFKKATKDRYRNLSEWMRRTLLSNAESK